MPPRRPTRSRSRPRHSKTLAHWLEEIYRRFHRAQLLHSDPLMIPATFNAPADREIVALIAASLAYGNVKSIQAGIGKAMDRMDQQPAAFLADHTPRQIRSVFRGYRYRVTSDEDFAGLLIGTRKAIKRHGSLDGLMGACREPGDTDLLPSLERWVHAMYDGAGRPLLHLLPDPARGSACKRLLLFLRWVVRKDVIDFGGWQSLTPADLLIPMDTHMHAMARDLGFTRRKQANLAAALETTDAFGLYAPEDPLRYDFALTRPGIMGIDVLRPRRSASR